MSGTICKQLSWKKFWATVMAVIISVCLGCGVVFAGGVKDGASSNDKNIFADEDTSNVFNDKALLATETLLEKLKSKSLELRIDALYNFNREPQKYKITESLKKQIFLLADVEEKTRESASKGEIGEPYHANLTNALGNTMDSRAVPYLIHSFSGRGTIINLLKIGEPAVAPLLDGLVADETNSLMRIAFADALGEFLRPKEKGYTISTDMRNGVKKVLFDELRKSRNANPSKDVAFYHLRSSENADIRERLIIAIGYVITPSDKEIITAIENILAEDSYFRVKDGFKTYPVRGAAKKVLDKVKGSNKP